MKKTKIMRIITVLALAFTILSGCGSDPIQDDLKNYVNNQLPAVQTAENELKDTFSANVGENSTDNETLLAVLTDTIIPASDEAIEAAKKIVPATKEVAAVHDQYVTSLTTLNSGLVMMADVITNDLGSEAMDEVNDILASSQTQNDEFTAAVAALAKEHGLESK